MADVLAFPAPNQAAPVTQTDHDRFLMEQGTFVPEHLKFAARESRLLPNN